VREQEIGCCEIARACTYIQSMGIVGSGMLTMSSIFCCPQVYQMGVPVVYLILASPAIAVTGCSALMCGHACMGRCIESYADAMNKKDFIASYKCGQVLFSKDTGSCSSLRSAHQSCWNPCCGKSDS
jgi:hypothetical protein